MRNHIIGTMFLMTTMMGQSWAQSASQNPLAAYSSEWAEKKYDQCNTAARETYLSASERELIWVLNMARANPKLFCRTVVAPFAKENGIDMESEVYYLSLMREMNKMEPLGILSPDKASATSAACHAESSGKSGYTGHDRQNATCNKLKKFNGECCSYGETEPVGVIVTLLVDEDVPSLGHRYILLGAYAKIGVAIRPHKIYRTNAVLDLLRKDPGY